MKYCPNCGAPIEDNHKFCANCGHKLEAPEAVELPPEPVYTDDPALVNDPVLAPSPAPAPKPKTEKVPELTLEPDLWGLGAAATAAAAAAPAKPAEAPKPAAPAQGASPAELRAEAAAPKVEPKKPVEQQAAPNYADYMPKVEKEEPLHYTQQEYDNVPNDYTMSQQPQQTAGKMPDETLMLIWSIVLTVLCNIPGIVGLVMTLQARSLPFALKVKKLNTAKIWLIVGTALYALGFLGNLF